MSRHRGLAGALGALLVLGGCASTTQEHEVQRLQARSAYEQALKNLSERRISLGLVGLNEAVRLDPDNPIYRNALGVVQLDLKRPAEAQAQFQRAIELEPAYAEAQHNLGLAHAEQGRFDEAIGRYQKALSIPTYATPEVAYHNLGNAYMAQGKLPEAEEAFRAAIQMDPRMTSAHFGLGTVLLRAGRPEEARAALRTARDLEPDSPFGRAAREALRTLGEGG
jgi:type IV pilus assembly protein PilF